MKIAWIIFGIVLTPLRMVAQDSNILSAGDKARVHVANMFGPLAFIGSATSAGIEQWRHEPPEWKGGLKGYGKRYASSHGYLIAQNSAAFGIDNVFHIDSRYRASKRVGLSARAREAISQTFVAYTDAGHRTVNWSVIGGNMAAGQISNTWFPASNSCVSDGFVRGGVGIGYSALSNLVREFWPNVRRKFKH